MKKALSLLLALALCLGLTIPALAVDSLPEAYRQVVQSVVDKYGVYQVENWDDAETAAGFIHAFTADLTDDGQDELSLFYATGSGIVAEVYTRSGSTARQSAVRAWKSPCCLSESGNGWSNCSRPSAGR